MRPIQRILVAIKDPLARKQPALLKASQLALCTGARLELFHALSDPLIVHEYDAGSAALRRREAAAVDDARGRLEKIAAGPRRHGLEVHGHVTWDYPPHEAILRRAMAVGADLVVVERHGGAHRLPWLLSYTDWEVLRLAGCPVLLVKSGRPWRRPALLAAVDPAHRHAKPARLDTQILEVAQALRLALRGRLEVLHAYTPPLLFDPGLPEGGAALAAGVLAGAEREARARLAALLGRLQPRATGRVVRQDDPATAIVTAARESRAAIVVMGAVSRSALRRLFIGSTAAAVLDSLQADVLVVKPGGTRPAISRRPRGPSVITLRAPVG